MFWEIFYLWSVGPIAPCLHGTLLYQVTGPQALHKPRIANEGVQSARFLDRSTCSLVPRQVHEMTLDVDTGVDQSRISKGQVGQNQTQPKWHRWGATCPQGEILIWDFGFFQNPSDTPPILETSKLCGWKDQHNSSPPDTFPVPLAWWAISLRGSHCDVERRMIEIQNSLCQAKTCSLSDKKSNCKTL